MEFGPEIKVDGKRPEWLGNAERVWVSNFSGSEIDQERIAGRVYWPNAKSIRLPANHPHYTTPTPDERALALVKRMAEWLAESDRSQIDKSLYWQSEARAIVAALEPVDGDLVEAREICASSAISEYDDPGNREVTLGSDLARHYRDGSYDKNSDMRRALAAIKRGRQLEKEGK